MKLEIEISDHALTNGKIVPIFLAKIMANEEINKNSSQPAQLNRLLELNKRIENVVTEYFKTLSGEPR